MDALRQASNEVGADWNVVVTADAAPLQSTDWRNLNHLIAKKVIPLVERTLIQAENTALAYHLNWLQRYGQVVMLTACSKPFRRDACTGRGS